MFVKNPNLSANQKLGEITVLFIDLTTVSRYWKLDILW